jgi:hypothetical protein
MITAAAARRKALFSGGVFLARYRDRFMTDLSECIVRPPQVAASFISQ